MAANAQRKPDIDLAPPTRKTETEKPGIAADLDGASLAAHPSPARALQARLHAQFVPASRQMLSRYVTLALMLTCIGTWIAGSGLNTIV